jgi:acyl-CoA thioesterase-1
MRRTGERFEAIPTLNRVAAEVMEANGVVINDLYAYVLPHAKEWQEADQVHFNATGNAALGKQVARTIEDALKQRQ